MPKRPNPFGDNSPLQFKSHITPKEVDLGVDKASKMQLVYEKTRNLLYTGARKTSDIPSHGVEQPMSIQNPAPSRGQLCINFEGGLCNNDRQTTVPCPTAKEDSMDQDTSGCYGNNNNIVSLPPGQMQIDKSGQLRKATVPGCQVGTALHCHCCRSFTASFYRRCQTCERLCCVDCLCVACSRCQSDFCKTCYASASICDTSTEIDWKCQQCK